MLPLPALNEVPVTAEDLYDMASTPHALKTRIAYADKSRNGALVCRSGSTDLTFDFSESRAAWKFTIDWRYRKVDDTWNLERRLRTSHPFCEDNDALGVLETLEDLVPVDGLYELPRATKESA